ncbi:MAG TPA: hypothetical protein PLY99_16920, partial [Acidovorax temperans]|nr:hypothetical protein [Acidovorax temperans]
RAVERAHGITQKEAAMLTPEQIDLAIQQHVDPVATYGRLHNFARAIEAEVRKQDEALIRQMLEALEKVDQAMPFPVARQAITAARARLGEKT